MYTLMCPLFPCQSGIVSDLWVECLWVRWKRLVIDAILDWYWHWHWHWYWKRKETSIRVVWQHVCEVNGSAWFLPVRPKTFKQSEMYCNEKAGPVWSQAQGSGGGSGSSNLTSTIWAALLSGSLIIFDILFCCFFNLLVGIEMEDGDDFDCGIVRLTNRVLIITVLETPKMSMCYLLLLDLTTDEDHWIMRVYCTPKKNSLQHFCTSSSFLRVYEAIISIL